MAVSLPYGRAHPIPRAAVVAALVWLGAYALGLGLIGDRAFEIVQGDLLYAVPDLAGAAACAWVVRVRRSRLGVRHSPSIAWLGVACGLSFVADMVYAGYYYVGGQDQVFPSWADPVWLAADAAFVMAVLYAFPGVGLLRRLRGILDATVAGLGLAAAMWVTGITTADGQGIASVLVAVAYPVSDLIMLVLLLSVGVSGHRKMPLYLQLLGLSICLLVATDLLSAYTTTFDAYPLGSWLDLGWQASAVATVLAVVCAGRTPPEQSLDVDGRDVIDSGRETTNTLPLDRDALGLAPLVAGAAGAFLVVISQASSDSASRVALVLAALTVGAVFVRLQLSIADQRAVSRRLDKALREQKQLAITDMLTDLYNRRFIEEVLRLTASRSDRDDAKICVAILDLDGFKTVNDTHGHQSGDAVLAEVAARLRRTVRVADVVGRWGGEEFLVVFPVTDLAEAMLVSDRMRRAVSGETIRLADGTRITVTASAGVAEMVSGAGDVDTLLWQADQALYAAKEAGRDRVFAWDAQGQLVAYR